MTLGEPYGALAPSDGSSGGYCIRELGPKCTPLERAVMRTLLRGGPLDMRKGLFELVANGNQNFERREVSTV